MRKFLEFVARQLIDGPATANLREETTTSGQSFVLVVPATEVGKIIGKQGHTIQAIRSLLVGAARSGQRVSFEIEEQSDR